MLLNEVDVSEISCNTFKTVERSAIQHFDTETLEIKQTEMFISGHKASLVKDTSYRGLMKVSFTLKEY